MTQNTQTKMTDESSVYIDEVDIFHPVELAEDATSHLREELEAERDRLLRLAAEYENYRRRTRRDIAQAASEGKRELLVRMLTTADDLDLALANVNESSSALAEGLRMIHRRFHNLLEAEGVVGFESKREKFDPERHEAFDVAFGTENEPETVHTEIRRGYFWNDKLLRPALVVVAQ